MALCAQNGRSSKIRTYDPHVPNVVLYQAELYSDRAARIAGDNPLGNRCFMQISSMELHDFLLQC